MRNTPRAGGALSEAQRSDRVIGSSIALMATLSPDYGQTGSQLLLTGVLASLRHPFAFLRVDERYGGGRQPGAENNEKLGEHVPTT
jgi:hypothetical protein